MPIREKLRRAFRRASTSSTSLSPTTTTSSSSTSASSSSHKSRHTSYKPGEHYPLKYRQAPDKAHTALLCAFSFGDPLLEAAEDAPRRRSGVSQYSPHGSRMPSRRGSWVAGYGIEDVRSGEMGMRDQGEVLEEAMARVTVRGEGA